VQESKIGQVCELQWVVLVLLEHWIGGGKRQRRLSTTSRSYGRAPVGRRAREEEGQCKCGCVNAKESAMGAQGCASSRGGGTASESRCWRPTACVAATGRARAEAGQRGARGRRQREELGRRPAVEQCVGVRDRSPGYRKEATRELKEVWFLLGFHCNPIRTPNPTRNPAPWDI
jgi:hypothetical protein